MRKEIMIIVEPDHTYYMVQKIKTKDLYLRTKLITEFLEKETKRFEFVVNNEIKAILREKGINILTNKESDYKQALNALKTIYNKVIDIEDIYKEQKFENCEVIGLSTNGMTVVIEDNKYLQVGVQIKEIEIS